MEKKEQNYIRQLLLELEDYLFSLSWYDGEDRLKTFRDVSNIKSIFQLVPKRYLKLLEGKIYTQQELSKAREEGRRETLIDIWDIATTERGKDIDWGGEVIARWADKELSKLTTK